VPTRRRRNRSSRKSPEQSAFGSCRAAVLRLFESYMTLMNLIARFFRPSMVRGNASLPESGSRSILMQLTESCVTIAVFASAMQRTPSTYLGRRRQP